MKQLVLAIDDAPETHDLLKLHLESEGLRLCHAFDSCEGFDMAVQTQPDLILLDVIMPELGGFELCRRLKQDARTEAIPIIFLSGASDSFNKVTGLELGAVDYVTKPFEPPELKARVRAALRTKRYHMLIERAQIDGLTGLGNRAYFDTRLAAAVASARRHGRPLCLLLGDLDRFKQLNDRFGHPFGDRVLQTFAEVLQANVRACDVPCRFGGDEFAVILIDTVSSAGAALVRRLEGALEAVSWSGVPTGARVTASFGLASTDALRDPSGLTGEALIRAADAALYAAKRSGRGEGRTASSADFLGPAQRAPQLLPADTSF